MQRITKYKQADDGTYTAVISGLTLGNDETQLLDAGYDIAVDVTVYDPYKITDKQRRKIFALLNDIYIHTGQPQEDLRQMFQFYLETIKGYESISLSNTTVTKARELIEIILEWTFLHNVSLNFKTTDLLKEDGKFIYLTVINRQCAICGKPNSDLAHRQAVGSGRNRSTISHVGAEILALCRQHHNEQHQIGVDTFDDKYYLHGAWIKADEKLNKMLRGETNGSTQNV